MLNSILRSSQQAVLYLRDAPVLNLWFGPGFGTIALVPTVPLYRFLLLDTTDYLHFSHIGTVSVPFRYHYDSKSGET